jgi:hypothetical protein
MNLEIIILGFDFKLLELDKWYKVVVERQYFCRWSLRSSGVLRSVDWLYRGGSLKSRIVLS